MRKVTFIVVGVIAALVFFKTVIVLSISFLVKTKSATISSI